MTAKISEEFCFAQTEAESIQWDNSVKYLFLRAVVVVENNNVSLES